MVAKSSARRSGFHCGTTLNMAPKRMFLVRAAIQALTRMPLGMTSYPSYWKWCSVVQKLS